LIVIKGGRLIEVKRKGIDGRRRRAVLHCALKEGVEGGRRGRQENGRRRRGGCRAGEVLEEGAELTCGPRLLARAEKGKGRELGRRLGGLWVVKRRPVACSLGE
jgi:hypothetical protein